ncbi:archease [Chloroflexota bacterium]
MEGDFEFLDHTADVGIIAYGADTKQAFANAARGLFSLITKLDDINENLYRDIEVTATDEAGLLVDWLNELIYQFDTDNVLFRRFDIIEFGYCRLKARAYGEKVNSSRHRLKTGVKAATYHLLEISQGGGGRVQVLFDI